MPPSGQIQIPRRAPGRPSAAAQAAYDVQCHRFCRAMQELRSTLEFSPSSRGWCYILEEHGLGKGDFDTVQTLINDLIKRGDLSPDITVEDVTRETVGLIETHDASPSDWAERALRGGLALAADYTPFVFWETVDTYVEIFVEKIDLLSLFAPVCARYFVPITNTKGWADLHARIHLLERMKHWHAKGKRCVLLYCGDHDPGGLNISNSLRDNLVALKDVQGVDWEATEERLEIARFGLNADFIRRHRLSWIENLKTANKDKDALPLDHPRHPDHGKPYVQEYLREFGARKVEGNALITRPAAGQQLCRAAIEEYVNPPDVRRYARSLEALRAAVQAALPDVLRRLADELEA